MKGKDMVDRTCKAFVYWWDGEYEGNCELDQHHRGDHYDGISWFNENRECTDSNHTEEEKVK